jgi:hypothetical protein
MRTLLASLTLVACGPSPAPPNATVQDRRSLRVALAQGDVDVVGVTVDPASGDRFVLEARRGLYRIEEDSSVLLRKVDEMVPIDRPLRSAFTDVAALGDGRFAMTAQDDGFLLDTNTGSFEQHFCYVPGEIVDEYRPTPIVQMTQGLTFDPGRGLMYAQPQTFEGSTDGDVLRSQVGQFATSGGEGFGWMEIGDEDFVAGGMAALGGDDLLLGRGSELRVFDLATGDLGDALDLGSSIGSIEGLAKIHGSNRVLLVDGASDELVELEILVEAR